MMKVHILTDEHSLMLLPENERDAGQLEKLFDCYAVSGFGRDAESMQLLHITIPLKKKK